LKAADDAHLADDVEGLRRNILASKPDLARGLREQAADEVDHRRLAGPVRADDAHHGRGFEFEADAIEDPQAAEPFAQIFDPKRCVRVGRMAQLSGH